jgi:hypothetical protein
VIQEYDEFYFSLPLFKKWHTNKKIIAEIGELTYDYLVIATGSKTNFWQQRRSAIVWKTIPQALNIRSFIENFEQGFNHWCGDQNSLINFVLVGGGPTGVELAGALAEMKVSFSKRLSRSWYFKMQITYSKWWSHLEYHEREIICCCRAILVNLRKSGKMCV